MTGEDYCALVEARRAGHTADAAAVAFAGGVLAVALVVQPRGPSGPLAWRGARLPSLCPVRALTGRRCPGCGMSRGLVHLVRGNPRNAVKANPLSPLAALLIAARGIVGIRRLLAG